MHSWKYHRPYTCYHTLVSHKMMGAIDFSLACLFDVGLGKDTSSLAAQKAVWSESKNFHCVFIVWEENSRLILSKWANVSDFSKSLSWLSAVDLLFFCQHFHDVGLLFSPQFWFCYVDCLFSIPCWSTIHIFSVC